MHGSQEYLPKARWNETRGKRAASLAVQLAVFISVGNAHRLLIAASSLLVAHPAAGLIVPARTSGRLSWSRTSP